MRMITRWRDTRAAAGVWPAPIHRLNEVRTPTLIVATDQDVPDILEVADLFEASIDQARKVVIRGTGHHLNMEQPDEFNRVVLNVLASLGSGALAETPTGNVPRFDACDVVPYDELRHSVDADWHGVNREMSEAHGSSRQRA